MSSSPPLTPRLRLCRPYQSLATLPDAPQLPMSYPAMFLLSLIPPVYFWVMDERVEARNRREGLSGGGGK